MTLSKGDTRFDIVCGEARTFELDAESNAEARAWVAAVRTGIASEHARVLGTLKTGSTNEAVTDIVTKVTLDTAIVGDSGGKFWKKSNMEERVKLEAAIHAQAVMDEKVQAARNVPKLLPTHVSTVLTDKDGTPPPMAPSLPPRLPSRSNTMHATTSPTHAGTFTDTTTAPSLPLKRRVSISGAAAASAAATVVAVAAAAATAVAADADADADANKNQGDSSAAPAPSVSRPDDDSIIRTSLPPLTVVMEDSVAQARGHPRLPPIKSMSSNTDTDVGQGTGPPSDAWDDVPAAPPPAAGSSSLWGHFFCFFPSFRHSSISVMQVSDADDFFFFLGQLYDNFFFLVRIRPIFSLSLFFYDNPSRSRGYRGVGF